MLDRRRRLDAGISPLLSRHVQLFGGRSRSLLRVRNVPAGRRSKTHLCNAFPIRDIGPAEEGGR